MTSSRHVASGARFSIAPATTSSGSATPKTFTVHQFMTRNPRCISASALLTEAREVLQTARARHLPVVDGAHLVGLVCLADVYFAERGRTGQKVTARDAMEPALTCPPDAPLERVAERMARNRASAAIVVDAGQIIGIFTTTDALQALAWIAAPVEEQSVYETLRIATVEQR